MVNLTMQCSLASRGISSEGEYEVKLGREYMLPAPLDPTQYEMCRVECPHCNAPLLLLTYPRLATPGFWARLLPALFAFEAMYICYRLLRSVPTSVLDVEEQERKGAFRDQAYATLGSHVHDAVRFSEADKLVRTGALQHSVLRINDERVKAATWLDRDYPKGTNRVFRDSNVSNKRIQALLMSAEKEVDPKKVVADWIEKRAAER